MLANELTRTDFHAEAGDTLRAHGHSVRPVRLAANRTVLAGKVGIVLAAKNRAGNTVSLAASTRNVGLTLFWILLSDR